MKKMHQMCEDKKCAFDLCRTNQLVLTGYFDLKHQYSIDIESNKCYSLTDPEFVYELNKLTVPDSFDSDIGWRASNGLYFCWTEYEARNLC